MECFGRFQRFSCCDCLTQCALGDGDCNTNAECGKGLKCGSNNCDRSLSTPIRDRNGNGNPVIIDFYFR